MKDIVNTTLSNIANSEQRAIISGPFGSNISKKYFVSKGVPVIRGNNLNISSGTFNDSGYVYVTNKKAIELNCYAHKGDLIFTAAGTLGQVGLIPNNAKYNEYVISNKQIRVTIDTNKVDVLYAYYWFSSPWIKKYLVRNNKGSTVPLLTLSEIKLIPIKYPRSLSVQRKIVRLLQNIDSKIANNNAISKELESMAKTIYDYWFLQFEFPDKDGKPYKSNGGKMVWNDQLKQEIPEGWEVRKLKDIIVENPKSKIKVKEAQQDHFGDIPFFTSGQSILSMDEKLVTGMNCYLNTGGNADVKYFYGPASYSTDTWSIKGKVFMEYLLPFILKNFQRSMDDKFFQGTGLRHLQKPLLKDYPILVPNEEIISKFIPLVSDVFKKVSDSYRENIELEKMRNFLLPMLMNGQVTIKD